MEDTDKMKTNYDPLGDNRPLRILILEDSELDVELIRSKLQNEFDFIDRVVYDKEAFSKEIIEFNPDIILSDYSMPQFNGLEALAILKTSKIQRPFIVVTGAIDEETAVLCIKAGADDYLLKDRLARLPAAIRQSIKQNKIELEKEIASIDLALSHMRLRELLNRLEWIRDDEKKRISMEIHDQLGQELTASKLGLFYLKQQLESKSEMDEKDKAISIKINELIALSGNTINTVRRIAHQLRPVILDDLGLIPALEWMTKNFNETTDISWKINVDIKPIDFSDKFTTAAFRIIQETITNVIRHSKASVCSISVNSNNGKLNFITRDNGVGFELESERANGKLGLFGIEERIKPWKGELNIITKKGKGTEVTVVFPLDLIC